MNMQYNLDQKEQINAELKKVRIKQQALVGTTSDVEKQESETQRYLTPFTENEILEYFHDYSDSVNT
jgi:hypothetical protein